ncbi:methyltransferase domain-containing protein [Sorangium sp. So ce861]|uniref:methyltransferase domain-containing protein n=1 Tax=Sorangium sp. So ce861 TaxID=3133323 RepID=UPI003F5D5E6B
MERSYLNRGVDVMYDYDREFYDIMNREAMRSAEPILRLLLTWFNVTSVVDFGCGHGAWLKVWKQLGVPEVLGLDGAHVESGALLVDPSEFRAADLTRPVQLGRRFDLVQSLEVGEHLPREAARDFVGSLTRHGSVVLFSAAPPGQGGEFHINERPYGYWRELFDERGYLLLDAIRPSVKDDPEVSYWYRFNTFIYVRRDALPAVPGALLDLALPVGKPIPDVAPLSMKLWRLMLRPMPPRWITYVARNIIKPRVVQQHRREAAARSAERGEQAHG